MTAIILPGFASRPEALVWTAVSVAGGAALWATYRRSRWRSAAGWAALALAGQACSLQLIWAGADIRLQMFYGWSTLLRSYQGLFLVAVLLQAGIVLWGGRKLWPKIYHDLRTVLSWPQVSGLLLLTAYGATAIEPGVAQALVGEGPLRPVLLHVTKIALGLLVFGVGALNLLLAVAAAPREECEKILARWQDSDRRWLPWGCALWVVATGSLLAWQALNHMPHVPDEVAYAFQAKYFALGKLYLSPPPNPEAFFCPFRIVEGGKWYASPPAGWPFVLAVGYLLNAPWLVNPLLGGAAILLAHRLVRRLYGKDVADPTVLLLAASPWVLFLSASLMPHPLSLVCSLAGLVGAERAKETGSLIWAATSGLSIGALIHVRVLEGAVMAVVVGVWWLGSGWRKVRLPALVTAGVAGLAMVGLFLLYNRALTGDAFQVPINKFVDQTYYKGANRLGFGRNVGNVGWRGLDALPGHGPLDVAMNTNQNLYMLNFELFGWTCGSMLFVFLLLVKRRFREMSLMWGIVVAVWAATSLYWFSGGPDFGARYWYQMVVPLAVLTVRGVQHCARCGDEAGVAGRSSQRVWGFVVLASLLGLLNVIPWRSLDKYHYYRGIRPVFRELEREHNFGRSLVFVRGPWWPDYVSAFARNPARFDRDAPGPLYARELDMESNARLAQYYNDRPIWIVAGPSVANGEARILAGPLPAGEIPGAQDVSR